MTRADFCKRLMKLGFTEGLAEALASKRPEGESYESYLSGIKVGVLLNIATNAFGLCDLSEKDFIDLVQRRQASGVTIHKWER